MTDLLGDDLERNRVVDVALLGEELSFEDESLSVVSTLD